MTSKYEVTCNNCGSIDFVSYIVKESLLGNHYCSNCQDKAPDDWPPDI